MDSRPILISCDLHVDDRGTLHMAANCMKDMGIERLYIIKNFSSGMIRAWHGHKKGDTYIHVLEGAAKVAGKNMEDGKDVVVHTITAEKPQMLHVPAGWYNGTMSLTDNTKLLVLSTLTFAQVKDDDVRDAIFDYDKVWKVLHR